MTDTINQNDPALLSELPEDDGAPEMDQLPEEFDLLGTDLHLTGAQAVLGEDEDGRKRMECTLTLKGVPSLIRAVVSNLTASPYLLILISDPDAPLYALAHRHEQLAILGDDEEEEEPEAAPRRPRKPRQSPPASMAGLSDGEAPDDAPKRGPGRPRKVKPGDAPPPVPAPAPAPAAGPSNVVELPRADHGTPAGASFTGRVVVDEAGAATVTVSPSVPAVTKQPELPEDDLFPEGTAAPEPRKHQFNPPPAVRAGALGELVRFLCVEAKAVGLTPDTALPAISEWFLENSSTIKSVSDKPRDILKGMIDRGMPKFVTNNWPAD